MRKMITALMVTMMILTGCGGKPTLKAAIEKADFAGVGYSIRYGDDMSYVTIDTNPYDIDDHFDRRMWETVLEFNKLLGFPESVGNRMNQTSWSQGTQTYENENFSASWTYHPDQGLEVTYEETK